MWEWQNTKVFSLALFSGGVCCCCLFRKARGGKYCVYFHQVILQISVSFSYPGVLASQLGFYRNEDVFRHLQFLNAKILHTHLGVVSTSFLLGEWDDCTGISHSTALPWGSLLSPLLSIVATLPTNYQMHLIYGVLSWLRESQKAAKLDVMPSLKFASVFFLYRGLFSMGQFPCRWCAGKELELTLDK